MPIAVRDMCWSAPQCEVLIPLVVIRTLVVSSWWSLRWSTAAGRFGHRGDWPIAMAPIVSVMMADPAADYYDTVRLNCVDFIPNARELHSSAYGVTHLICGIVSLAWPHTHSGCARTNKRWRWVYYPYSVRRTRTALCSLADCFFQCGSNGHGAAWLSH